MGHKHEINHCLINIKHVHNLYEKVPQKKHKVTSLKQKLFSVVHTPQDGVCGGWWVP